MVISIDNENHLYFNLEKIDIQKIISLGLFLRPSPYQHNVLLTDL